MLEEAGQSSFYIQLTVAISALRCAIHYCGVPMIVTVQLHTALCLSGVMAQYVSVVAYGRYTTVVRSGGGKRDLVLWHRLYSQPLPSFV